MRLSWLLSALTLADPRGCILVRHPPKQHKIVHRETHRIDRSSSLQNMNNPNMIRSPYAAKSVRFLWSNEYLSAPLLTSYHTVWVKGSVLVRISGTYKWYTVVDKLWVTLPVVDSIISLRRTNAIQTRTPKQRHSTQQSRKIRAYIAATASGISCKLRAHLGCQPHILYGTVRHMYRSAQQLPASSTRWKRLPVPSVQYLISAIRLQVKCFCYRYGSP